MRQSFLKATELIGYRIMTIDGQSAALRDLVLDAAAWTTRYLAVEADAWTPGHEVLVPLRSLAGIDEARREVEIALSFDELRKSPPLGAGTPVTRDFEERFQRFLGWEDQWRAEIDPEVVQEPPIPAAPPADEPEPAEANADAPGLLRLEDIRIWPGETRDGKSFRLLELLIDDSDWSIAYLELSLQLPEGDRSCLLHRSLMSWADPDARRLYAAVDAADLLGAQAMRYPVPEAEEREMPTLERPLA